MQEPSKPCCTCSTIQPLSNFPLDKGKPDGRARRCKSCNNAVQLKYRRSGKAAQSIRANPVGAQLSAMVCNSRKRALPKGIPHTITSDDLRHLVVSHCPYSGIELRWSLNTGLNVKGAPRPDSPSLDRLDPSKGYVPGNVVIVAHRANAIKQDATEQELIHIGLNIARLKMQLACPE